MPDSAEYRVIKYQLAKSATSAGANYEEAQAATSRPDFTSKIKISLREVRESNYWLRMIGAIDEREQEDTELAWLSNESDELKRILGAIATKTSLN